MPIPDIRLNNIRIGDVVIQDVPKWMSSDPPVALPVAPPITMEVGIPIVNIPGCVEAHKDNQENVNLKNEDDKGVMTLCDAGTPYYTALDYDRNNIKLEQEPPEPPAYKAPPSPEAPETKTPEVPKTEAPMPECPTREQQLKNPVGKILEGNKKITGYEMVGKECLMVTEQLSIPDQIIGNIPNAGAVTTTASIAVVATTSALLAKPLADLLLKVVKPTVKKVMKKVATLRGKKIPVQSRGERLAEQRQRNQAVKALRSVRPLKK
tara:strand:- start:334 stop:1128 length:795 start_codon:yes stop_codon:yes gene_type:complete